MQKKFLGILAAALLLATLPFGLGVLAAATDPVVTYPVEGSEVALSDFDITWQPVANVSKYVVNVRDVTTNELIVNAIETTDTKLTVEASKLVVGHAFRVGMRADLTAGDPYFFPIVNFTVVAASEGTTTTTEPTEPTVSLAGKKLVAFGDSLTARGTWPATVAQKFGMELVNSGVAGETSAQGLARFQSAVAAHNPDFVTINFGMNDQCLDVIGDPTKAKVSQAEYRQNLESIVDQVKALGAEPILLTISFVNEEAYFGRHPIANYEPYGGAMGWIDQYNEIIREVAAEKGVSRVDIREACDEYTTAEFLDPDGVHLAAVGNSVYAQMIEDYFVDTYNAEIIAPAPTTTSTSSVATSTSAGTSTSTGTTTTATAVKPVATGNAALPLAALALVGAASIALFFSKKR